MNPTSKEIEFIGNAINRELKRIGIDAAQITLSIMAQLYIEMQKQSKKEAEEKKAMDAWRQENAENKVGAK